MEYKDKDRNIQNEFLAKLQNCFDAYDNADNSLEEILDFIKNIKPEGTSEADLHRSDLLHIFEDFNLSDAALINVGRKLQNIADERRNWHNIHDISQVFMQNYNKIHYKDQRPFLRSIIEKSVKNLDQPYNFRVMNDEEIKNIISVSEEKKVIVEREKVERPSNSNEKGRCKGSKNLTIAEKNNILNEISKGRKIKDVAESFGIALSTVYKLRAKYEDLSSIEA